MTSGIICITFFCRSVKLRSIFVHRLGLLSEEEVRIEQTPFDTLLGHLTKKLEFGKNSCLTFSSFAVPCESKKFARFTSS